MVLLQEIDDLLGEAFGLLLVAHGDLGDKGHQLRELIGVLVGLEGEDAQLCAVVAVLRGVMRESRI